MNKTLLLSFLAVCILAGLAAGVWMYQKNLPPTQEEVSALFAQFTESLAAGRLSEAASLLTAETRDRLRKPGTALGEAVYRSLALKSVDHVFREEGNSYTADVTLTALDTLKIMAKAMENYSEASGVDMEEIYAELLKRDDLPTLDNFCIVHVVRENGQLRIAADTALMKVLEGNLEENSSTLNQILTGGLSADTMEETDDGK